MREDLAQRLHVNEALTIQALTGFIREEVEKAGFQSVVLGLSGGIDSALVAYLATRALGRERVHAVLMPYKSSSASSLSDARAVVADLNLNALEIPITGPVDAYFEQMDALLGEPAPPLRRGNRMARERMATLFDLSAHFGALVLGTSNKTELLLGYGTQFGDLASALNPIGDLYKCQIRQLSAAVGVPQSILAKPPSADLWADQTDEKELGFTYDEADEVLYQLVDLRLTPDEVVANGARQDVVRTVVRRITRNQYKRKPPIIAKVSTRTIGIDFRYLRDWGL
ncbi:NAD+ synthase [Alicyclobacillus cycloheptanicus]|uniref:NH(3)-dependent NAD(+) synthetase n=1 Tax=Alicyclobacillus cycloheptanicus TaxID=1457 RepID=A0ABT9XG57_9BACL|nr:NAD+ synthase [Alicyclobacillus cycloheptanicus]MDQ0188746.1 NAD+ synthase [Alicyclobacillus cycloheptanicus]WDM00594.1 NAD+ synthase [Alicyclobacillus cycloheptanicus]